MFVTLFCDMDGDVKPCNSIVLNDYDLWGFEGDIANKCFDIASKCCDMHHISMKRSPPMTGK